MTQESAMTHTLLEAAMGQLRLWGEASPEELAAYYAEDVVLVDPTQPNLLKGQAQTLQWFKGVYETFGKFELKILCCEEIASNVIYHELLGTFNPGRADEYHMIFRSTVVWRRVGSSWKIHHEQWDVNACDKAGQRLK